MKSNVPRVPKEAKALVSIAFSVLILELVYLPGVTTSQLFYFLLAGSSLAMLYEVHNRKQPLLVFAIAMAIMLPVYMTVFISPYIIVGFAIAELILAIRTLSSSELSVKSFIEYLE